MLTNDHSLVQWENRVMGLLLETKAERLAQLKKWKLQRHDLPTWATILGEEYGELCQAILHTKFGGAKASGLRDEALQVAAVALAIAQFAEHGEA